jgi:hypothetical protein
MAESIIDAILNAVIPWFVFIFIGWILYKIPLVTKMVGAFKEWWANRGRQKDTGNETVTLKSIAYE